MIAKICDKCGQIFRPQEIINHIEIQYVPNLCTYAVHNKYDLCPSCIEQFNNWIENKTITSIHTYMDEFIKRFPEYQGRESEVVGSICKDQVFSLSDCMSWEPESDITYDECAACWNKPYKENE